MLLVLEKNNNSTFIYWLKLILHKQVNRPLYRSELSMSATQRKSTFPKIYDPVCPFKKRKPLFKYSVLFWKYIQVENISQMFVKSERLMLAGIRKIVMALERFSGKDHCRLLVSFPTKKNISEWWEMYYIKIDK